MQAIYPTIVIYTLPTCQNGAVIPDFGIAGHFILRIMNIHGVLDDCAIFIDFNFLCNSSNCKIVTISVKFNTKGKQKYASF